MSRTSTEIGSQPAVWARAAARAHEVGEVVPTGARAAFVGCGSSYYTCLAGAMLRESAGHGESDAFVASQLPADRSYDVLVAVSRSGETTEVARALDASQARRKIAVTAVGGLAVGACADIEHVLDFADEESVIQTRFPTAVLALLRTTFGEDLGRVIDDGERALQHPLPEGPERYAQQVFLGSGWHVGLAYEAALKVREAAQAWSEAYPTAEYRHGPIAVASHATRVWLFGSGTDPIASEIRDAGAELVTNDLDPLAQLVVAQRSAVALAESRGLDPDRPRALSRAVVLS